MDENIKEMLKAAHEVYSYAVGMASQATSTDDLLSTLIQVEMTNGCILAEILAWLNEKKDGNIKKEK